MTDDVPVPTHLLSTIRLLQRHAFCLDPAAVADGRMDADIARRMDAAYPAEVGYLPFSTIWKHYASTVRDTEAAHRQAPSLSPRALRKADGNLAIAEKWLERRLNRLEQRLLDDVPRQLEMLMTREKIGENEVRHLQDLLNLHFRSDLPIEKTISEARLAELPGVLYNHDVDWNSVSDAWRDFVPDLRRAVIPGGPETLDSGIPLRNATSKDADAAYVVHYSFIAGDAIPGIDRRSKTASFKTRHLADFNERERAAFREALLEYSEILPVRFVEVEAMRFPPKAKACWRVYAGDIGEQGIAAFSHSPPSDPAIRNVGPLLFDRTHSLNSKHLRNNLLHEIGHALGLKHPFGYDQKGDHILRRALDDMAVTVMSYTQEAAEVREGLRPLDIATLQKRLSPFGTKRSNAGDTVYRLHDDSPLRVIVDSDGEDVLDASRRTRSDKPTVIDVSGEIYDPLKKFATVRVAEGTQIETVIGGAGTDVIYSGNGRHRLFGGDGADRFVIPAGGMHAIEDFSSEDAIELPRKEAWKTQITRDGRLHLHGIGRAAEPAVDVLLQPVGNLSIERLQEWLHVERLQPPDTTPETAAKAARGMQPALRQMQEWLAKDIRIEEVSDIRPGDVSRIAARKLDSDTPRRKP